MILHRTMLPRASLLALAVAAFACATKTAPPPGLQANRDGCEALYAHREDRFFALDVDAGGADTNLDAGDQDVVELGADASPACEKACMDFAQAMRLDAPIFTSCHESSVSIGCTLNIHAPQPCDVVGP
jgi:hypothetical protein